MSKNLIYTFMSFDVNQKNLLNEWKNACEDLGYKTIISEGFERNSYGIKKQLDLCLNFDFPEEIREQVRKQCLINKYGVWSNVPQYYK